jgi:hypothetical protein
VVLLNILSDITRGSGFKPIIQHEQQPIQQLILQTLITTGPQQQEYQQRANGVWTLTGELKKTYDYFSTKHGEIAMTMQVQNQELCSLQLNCSRISK